jgi:hypothetical protein
MSQILKANLNALFQTALLLTADPETAEASLASSLDSVDLSSSPQEDKSAILEKAIVLRSVQSARVISRADTAKARALLQPGLWPVLQIERRPRLCFVLRLLLGYATSSCAQMLSIEEDGVKALLQNAILQLHHVITANNPGTNSLGGVLSGNRREMS